MATKKNLTVRQIVKRYLEIHGYDGLYCEDCGCHVKDLMPCDGDSRDCRIGYYRAKKPGEDEADYYIGAKRGQYYG